jgi:hypothetical protein
MRKRLIALMLAASAVFVLVPGMTGAASARPCLRVHRHGVNLQIGICP